jgi:two-component system, OmpR family, sensor histidine kinase KdpD
VMLAVALTVANLAARVRLQAQASRERERVTAALYRLSQELAKERDSAGVARAATAHLWDHYGTPAAVFLPEERGGLQRAADSGGGAGGPDSDPVARWVFDRGHAAGHGTDTLPGSEALYMPLEASGGRVGVLAVRTGEASTPESSHTLELIATQTAMALERSRLAETARQSQMEAESERLRSSLLSSVSHDFRTPLATMVGASSALLAGPLEEKERRELAQSIYEESGRLSRYVNNLLDMTRLEAGTMTLHREWNSLEEVVGAALGRMREALAGRAVKVAIPESLPMVAVDARLLEQVLVNLIENAVKYTPEGSPIDIAAASSPDGLEVRVEDRGPGLPEGGEDRIFEKFYRGARRTEGAGLGLAICHAIIAVHGGAIRAQNREGGGARFLFTLPGGEPPPPLGSPERSARD